MFLNLDIHKMYEASIAIFTLSLSKCTICFQRVMLVNRNSHIVNKNILIKSIYNEPTSF